jgi:UDP-glucose 4-epimerase
MDNSYLEELIGEAENRGGGMLLNFNNKPAAVVLTVDKYNQLLHNPSPAAAVSPAVARTSAAKGGRHVLVTGGAGYIGAHLVRKLLEADFKVTVLDNLSSGKREHIPAEATFVEGDLADLNLLRDLFASAEFEAVFHMAASIEVEESVSHPEKYYENNVSNTGKLLTAMHEASINKIIFSSTAAVYGEPKTVPIKEDAILQPKNPYGYTKMLGEQMIQYFTEFAGMSAIVFRYFNACGFDYDGAITATHHSHLIPLVMEAAAGQRPHLEVYGSDYETFDGTCVRDYVHVLDIAVAHVIALDKIGQDGNFQVYNIGTGHGLSVKQIINSASEILNRIIPMEIGPRRAGDPAALVADNSKITAAFGFQPTHSDVATIINTSWNQISKHHKISA